jgi:hypothetical protein
MLSRLSALRKESSKDLDLSKVEAVQNCPICAKEYTSQERLDRHLESGCGKNGSAAYQCWLETCERSFTQAVHLLNHRLHHGDEREHGCQTCLAKFAKPESLSFHLTLVHSKVSLLSVPSPC